ncbi:hypothetical protein FQN57_003461 [Myotisia sp. PD_48]|nr:hypothetical protein FQN57_003461 [Myotisia sp. PD_48]
MSAEPQVVKKPRGRPRKVLLEPEPETAKPAPPKKTRTTKARKQSTTLETGKQLNLTKEAEITPAKSSSVETSTSPITKRPVKTSSSPLSAPPSSKKPPSSKSASPKRELPTSEPSIASKKISKLTEKKSSIVSASAVKDSLVSKETKQDHNSISPQGQSNTVKRSVSVPPVKSTTASTQAPLIEATQSFNSKSSPSATPASALQKSPILEALATATAPPADTTPAMAIEPKKSSAGELAKSIYQSSRKNKNVTLPPPYPTPSPIVRTRDEIGRRGAPPNQTDIRNTPRYKSFARKWTSTIIALPILIFTSYALYQRVFLGKQPQGLPGVNNFKASHYTHEEFTALTSPNSKSPSKPESDRKQSD